jgi:hypothetical protein
VKKLRIPIHGLRSIAADRLDRAPFHRFLAKGLFLGGFGLFVNEGMPAVVIPLEVRGRRFATKIAVDALIIDVESPLYVFGIFVCDVSHKAPYRAFGLENRKDSPGLQRDFRLTLCNPTGR